MTTLTSTSATAELLLMPLTTSRTTTARLALPITRALIPKKKGEFPPFPVPVLLMFASVATIPRPDVASDCQISIGGCYTRRTPFGNVACWSIIGQEAGDLCESQLK